MAAEKNAKYRQEIQMVSPNYTLLRTSKDCDRDKKIGDSLLRLKQGSCEVYNVMYGKRNT